MNGEDYPAKYMKLIREIVLSNVDCDKYLVFLFGSRVHNPAQKRSDVDIGIWSFGSKSIEDSQKVYHKIVNALEESIVPYQVDIIDFNLVDNRFKKEALKKVEIWNQPPDLNVSSLF